MSRPFLLALAALTLAAPALLRAAPLRRLAAGPTSAPVRRALVERPADTPRPGCDACANWTVCEMDLHEAGASLQVVAIKNGVMCVYTADTPARVRVVQSLLARREDYLRLLDQAGETAHLCPSCRTTRGAALSGKLQRQVLDVEGGCITLTTSADPAVVAMIRDRAGVPAGARARN